MLHPSARQVCARDVANAVGVPVGRAEELQRVGGEGGSAVEATEGDPRMLAALCLVLPTHDDGSQARIGGDVMIDILRDVSLVVHEEAAPAEAQVLDQDRVARQLAGATVGEREMPEPDIALRVQPERHSMLQAGTLTVPDETIAGGAETAGSTGSDADDARLRAAGAQVKATDPAADRRAEHLIEHDAALLMLMFDSEEAAVRQRTDRKAGGIGDATQAEIAVARGRAAVVAASRHSCSPVLPWARPSSSGRCCGKRGAIMVACQCARRLTPARPEWDTLLRATPSSSANTRLDGRRTAGCMRPLRISWTSS